MKTPEQIISDAIETYKPIKIALLFSGGHDSLVSTHACSMILQKMNTDFVVYHGDTTIGIPETQQYVKEICKKYGWKLVIRKPPKRTDYYDELIKRFGFPGPTKQSHQIMYRRLKERAINKFVTHECKSSPHTRETVILFTGIRKQESRIRMGYINETSKENSKVWSNPIFWWSKIQCEKYMVENNLPRNPVKDRICISGECLCGAFAGKEELAEIRAAYPDVAKKLDELHELAKKTAFPGGGHPALLNGTKITRPERLTCLQMRLIQNRCLCA